MSGKTFSFYSGVHMIDISKGKTLSKSIKTDSTMRSYSDSEIDDATTYDMIPKNA